jgi:DNA (cytosine-5)-methyltransferase 1
MSTAAEFFSGIGLVRMGLERAGWSVVFANDIDPDKCSIYRANFGPAHLVQGDIRQVTSSMVPTVELATASFPCIDVSLAGNRNGLNGTHSSAYWEFLRILRGMGRRRPESVLLENVVGLLTSNNGRDLRAIILSLNELGYGCDVLAVDAAHFVPQSRPRLFICARRHPPEPGAWIMEPHGARPRAVVDFVLANQDLNWSHVPVPPLPQRRADLRDIVERFEPGHAVWWDAPKKAHLYSQISPRHRRMLRIMMSARAYSYATVYKRVRPAGCRAELRNDGLAGCLRTPRGGSSKQFVIEAGFGAWRVRNMTAREYARLQGVPDSFKHGDSYLKALFGYGDAVCVPVIEWIARNCLSTAAIAVGARNGA